MLIGKALLFLRYPLINLRDHLLQLLMLFSRHESRLTLILQTNILTGLLTQNQLSELCRHWCLSRDRLEDITLRFTRIEHRRFVTMLRSLILAGPQNELGELLGLQIVIGPALGVGVEGVNS